MRKLTLLFTILFLANGEFRLDPVKSAKLAKLLLEKNLTINFEIQQQNQTKFDLLLIREDINVLFSISTSTINGMIGLEFRLKNGRHKVYNIDWLRAFNAEDHLLRITFLLDGRRIVLLGDCQLLFESEDIELDFGKLQWNRLAVSIGGNDPTRPGLTLREFSADVAIPLQSHCPNLVMSQIGQNNLDQRNQKQEQPNELMENGTNWEQDKNDNSSKNLEQRMGFLEEQFSHWNLLFRKIESRMKRMELHQRGCSWEGSRLASGQRVRNQTECRECHCSTAGQLHCGPIGCPRLGCAHPVHVDGQCCPQCGRKCFYNGKTYESGDSFWPKQCVHCQCDNGKMNCEFRRADHCPQLDCAEQETPPNQCCPICLNADFCSYRNPCDENAICRSGRHSAICHCKEGFFGNGTKCYDVDECLWDEEARTQLGGCGEGTVCVNVPGSFKCECLPGYRKLGEKNCLDVVRI